MIDIKLLYPPKGPLIFKRMVDDYKLNAKKGDVVRVISKSNEIFGYAFYNPDSNIVCRLISRTSKDNFDIEEYIYNSVKSAYEFRKIFSLPSGDTNVYRVVYDWGDGLSGLVGDIFNDVCVFEVYSYAYFIRKEFLSKIVKEVIGVEDVYFVANSYVQTMEKFKLSGVTSKKVKVKENGIFFEVIIGEGYKTGFFCDQRENRKYLTQFANNKNVLDLFSYTGGFGIYLAKHGAKEVSCVELDEEACRMAKRNSNINSVKINVIRADAFNYLRQMIMNKNKFDIVICDPYKFISSKENMEEGLKKYQDINRLALEVVKSGGILVSCSCSGMLSFNQFISIIKSAASSAKRIVKIFKKSGAGPDHPYMVNYPEGEYLKVLWSFVE